MAKGFVQTIRDAKDQLYRNMLDQALKNTERYARQGEQQTEEVANTVTGSAMTSLNRGDLNNYDYSTSRRSIIDKAKAVKALSSTGIFNSPEYALNGKYSGLPELPYMQQLLEEKQMELAKSKEEDEKYQSRQQYLVNTWEKWSDMRNRLGEMTEENAPHFWAYADYLLNGNLSSPFDMDTYDSLWNEMDDREFFATQGSLQKQFEGLDWEQLTSKEATVKDQLNKSLTPGLESDVNMLTKAIRDRETVSKLETEARADMRFGDMSIYTGNALVLDENDQYMHSNPYFFVNNADIDEQTFNQATYGTRINWATREVEQYHSPYLDLGYQYLTDDELAVYNYYYKTDQQKAGEYLSALQSDLLNRRATGEQTFWETLATNKGTGWLATLSSLGMNVLNTNAAVLQGIAALQGNDNPNAAYYDWLNRQGYITGAQSEAIGELGGPELFGKTLGQHLYEGGMSGLNNLSRIAMFGPKGALAAAGVQSASSSLRETAGRDNMSGAAKVTQAVLTGLAEVGTEKIGLDALFDKGKKNAAKYLMGVIGAELGEETLNAIGQEAIEQAVAATYGHKADNMTVAEWIEELGQTGLQTLVSSLLMGSGGAINQAATNRATGRAVSTQGDVDALMEIAGSMEATTQSYQLAEKMNKLKKAGKKPSFAQLGELTQQLEADLSKEQSRITNQVMDEAIEERLIELGTDADTARKNAPAVRKIARGQDPTAFERAAVRWDDNASQVVKELAAKENTDQKRIEVEGAPTAEPEGQRAGQKWKSDLGMKTFEKTSEVLGKRRQLADAVSTPAAQDVQKAVEAAEKKTSTSNTKAKNMTNKSVSYITEAGEAKGEFQRFEMKDGAVHVVVKTGDKETAVKVEDLTDEGGAGTAAIIEYTAQAHHNMTAAEANTMMQTYEKVGGNVKKFITDYEAVYAAGYAGVDAPVTALKDTVSGMVYEQAQREAAEAEEKRVERAKTLRKSVKGSVAWLGQVEDNSAIRGAGDVEALSEAKKGMTEAQQTTVEVVQALAEELRVNIVLYEGRGKNLGKLANGKYEPSTHTLYVDVNSGAASAEGIQAGKGTNTLGYAMMRTLGHELTHHIESTSAEGYAQYKAAVMKQLQENGRSWAELVRAKIESAADEGRKLTRMGAEAEVVADASEYMLQESSFTKKLDSGLYAKVKSFVQSFMEKVREIFTHITGEHRESAALRKVIDGVKQYTGNLQQLWDAALGETIQGESAMGETAGDVTETAEAAQFSAREKYDFSKSFAEQVDDWKNGNFPERDTLLLGRTPDVLQRIGFSDLPMTIDQKHMRYMLGTPKNNDHDLGEVIVKRLPELIADPVAIIANPAPTKGSRAPGVMIIFAETNNNADGRRIVGAVSVLENGSINGITIDSTRLETAHSRGDVDKKIADAVQKEQSGGNGVYYINKDALSLLEPGQSQVLGTLGRYGVINSIREAPEFVNSKFMKQTETTQFKRWFGDSKIVNEDGSPKVMYHGTPYGGFTVFKGWQYFTDNREYADKYQNPSASSIRGRYTPATNPQTYEVYLQVKKPFDTRDKKVRKIWQEEFYGNYSRTPLSERGLPDWTDGIDLVDFIEENGYDYDAIILDEGGVGGYGDEVKDRGVSVVVRDATQIKSATGNVGTFDPENPDIMYSTRDLPDMPSARQFIAESGDEVASTLEEKNALQIYRQKLDAYKTAVKETETAEEVLKDAQRALKATERALEIAKATKEDNETVAERKREKEEAELKWKKAGNNVNIKRMKQKGAYNALLKAEDTPHVRQVLDFARAFINESSQGTVEDFESAKAEAERQLAEMEAQYEELRTAGRTQMAAEQKKRLELQQRYARTFKSKVAEGIKTRRDEYEEREQKARAYRQTRDEVNKLRRGIGRTVRYLNTRRAHESDQRHIPHEMTKIVDYILAEFTDEKLARLSFSTKQAANLNSLYNKLKASDTDNTYFWDDEVEEKLRYIYDLSEEYHNLLYDESGKRKPPSLEGYEHEREMLTNIGDVIENIRRMVDAENEIFLEDKDDTFLEYSTNTAKALLERKDVHLLRGAAGDVQKIVNELLWTGNMTPVYFFERLQNDGLLTAFNAVREGQRKYGRILNEAKKFVLESKERHHYDKWVGDGLLTFETVQGHKITLTREQALWAYATAKREDSLELKKTEHLSKGGFHFRNPREDMGAKGLYRATDKAHQLKAADIQTINNWLTKEQKAYADELVEYLSTTMGDYGNEASMRMYGYKKFREKYYFPFRTWSAQQFQRGDEGSTNTGEASRIKSAGFTKNLTHKANTALEMSDFTDVIGDHIQAMTTYATMVAPVEDIKRLMNHKVADADDTQSTVRALIGQKYGLASQNYVTDFLRDLNGAVQTDNRAGGGIEKLISTFKRGAVAGSLSVVVQQPTAIFRAMAHVSPKYFSMNRETKNDGKLWEEMLRYSGAAVVKDAGKFDIGLGHSAADWVTGQDIMNPAKAFMRMKEQSATKAGKEMFDVFKEWLTFLPGFADQVTWKAMWKAVKNEQHDLHPEMDTSSEAFLEMCGKRFDDVMDHTQVYDSVLVKSNLMRSKNQLHKMATSFMSEPTLTLNIMIDALKGKHGWKQGAKMFAATAVSQIAAGTLAALVQAWNDDDDERNAKEKLLDRALYNIAGNLNPIEMIPYLSNIWDTVEGFTVQRSDMEVINDLVTYTKQVANGNLSGWKMVEKLGGTIANIFGVPLGNIMRDFRRGKNAIESEWGKADRENLGFITQENLQWFWADSKKAYYNRMVNAALNGEMEYYEEMMEYMQTSKMADESSIKTGMRGVLKKMVQSGEMTPEEATAFLNKYASYANEKDNTKKPLEWAAEKD